MNRLDRITNEIEVTEVSRKIKESRLQWYGHVYRRDESYVSKIVERIEENGARKRGIPRKRLENCLRYERKSFDEW